MKFAKFIITSISYKRGLMLVIVSHKSFLIKLLYALRQCKWRYDRTAESELFYRYHAVAKIAFSRNLMNFHEFLQNSTIFVNLRIHENRKNSRKFVKIYENIDILGWWMKLLFITRILFFFNKISNPDTETQCLLSNICNASAIDINIIVVVGEPIFHAFYSLK